MVSQIGKVMPKNIRPDIVRVTLKPEPCSIGECDNAGAKLKLTVDFFTRQAEIHGHRLEIGLGGGVLKVDLCGLRGEVLTPEHRIQPQVEQTVQEGRASDAGVGVGSISLGLHNSSNTSVTIPLAHVAIGGTTLMPQWVFRAQPGWFLEGRSMDLILRIKPQESLTCSCKYSYSTVDDDWRYRFDFKPNMWPLHKLFLSLGHVKETHKLLDECRVRKPSWGEWTCPFGGRNK